MCNFFDKSRESTKLVERTQSGYNAYIDVVNGDPTFFFILRHLTVRILNGSEFAR